MGNHPIISAKMHSALVAIGRADGGSMFVAGAYPGEPVRFYDGHSIDPQGRSLVALWQRGLITFDVVARLTPDGKKAIDGDTRITPGKRDFTVIE